MKKLVTPFVIVALVIAVIVLAVRSREATDLYEAACENIVEQCGELADEPYRSQTPDIPACARELSQKYAGDPVSHDLLECMADGDSCNEVLGCAFTVGVKHRRR